MAYRRKQKVGEVSTFKDELGSIHNPPPPLGGDGDGDGDDTSLPSSSSLAAKAIRASSAHRDSSLSSAYGQSALPSPRDSIPFRSSTSSAKDSSSYGFAPMKSSNEPKQGFWGVLASKAKSILDDDNEATPNEAPGKKGYQVPSRLKEDRFERKYQSAEKHPKTENPTLQRGLGAIASSLNYIGGTIGNALEEGISAVESRTADILQETRKLQINRKGSKYAPQNEALNLGGSRQQSTTQNVQPQKHADLEIQLKASRDVAMAMAAKAKLLLRELKTIKADLAFAKERCAQLEEENRILRDSREKGDTPVDDDLIRLQLETLLAEKARLAQENSVFARENRFLREVVEYHQLTMQDVVYLDESSEEVTEVYPVGVNTVPDLQSVDSSLASLQVSSPSSQSSYDGNTKFTKDDQVHDLVSLDPKETSSSVGPLSSSIQMPADLEKH